VAERVESHARLLQERGFTFQRMYKQEEIPPEPGERESLQDSLLIGLSFFSFPLLFSFILSFTKLGNQE